jgi:hypothetical protein
MKAASRSAAQPFWRIQVDIQVQDKRFDKSHWISAAITVSKPFANRLPKNPRMGNGFSF